MKCLVIVLIAREKSLDFRSLCQVLQSFILIDRVQALKLDGVMSIPRVPLRTRARVPTWRGYAEVSPDSLDKATLFSYLSPRGTAHISVRESSKTSFVPLITFDTRALTPR